MSADGNLISKGQGEGRAIMLQPFTPDQTAFNQMNQILAQKQQQKAAQAAKQQADDADKRDEWLKRLSNNYKYHPNDEKGIYELQKGLINKIENYKSGTPKTEIEADLAAYEYLVNTSKETLMEDNRIQHDMLSNAGKVWYKGTDYWEKANVPNEGKTAEELIQGIGRRSAAQKMVVQGGEKITNPYNFIDNIVKNAQVGDPKQVQYRDKYGNLVTETYRETDRNLLDKNLDFAIENNPEVLRVFGTPEAFKEQVYSRTKNEVKTNIKGAQNSNQGFSYGSGNASNGKINFEIVEDVPKVDLQETNKAYEKYLSDVESGLLKSIPDKKQRQLYQAKNPPLTKEQWIEKYPRKKSNTGWMQAVSKKSSTGNQAVEITTDYGVVDGTIKEVNPKQNKIRFTRKETFTDASGGRKTRVVEEETTLDNNLEWFKQHDSSIKNINDVYDYLQEQSGGTSAETGKQGTIEKVKTGGAKPTKAQSAAIEKVKQSQNGKISQAQIDWILKQ